MVEVESAFIAMALIIFIGYFGMLFFKKTKISETLVLMLIGLIIGPFFGLVGEFEITLFEGFLPFFASFALMIILFEGGMHLNFFKTIRDLPGAFIFTIITFIATNFLIAIVWFFFTGNLFEGVLLGAILGGTSSAIVIPLVSNTSANDQTKSLLGLESALTDALCVIMAVTMAEVIILSNLGGGGINLANVGSNLLSAFSIAAVVGGIFGFIWIKLLVFLEKKPYEYLLTLAVILFMYSIVQFFGGNGAIAALVFGIILGNSEDLTRMLRLTPRKVEGSIKSFQMEISFIVRTFFFVYLGLLFKLKFLNDLGVIFISFLILIAIIVARIIGSKLISKFNPVFKEDHLFITTLGARGLAAASLMSFPIIISVFSQEMFEKIAAIIFLIILFSNIITTIGVFIGEKIKFDKIKLEKISVKETSSK
ncbi:MAG: cation:proton antiporter [Candidatus ainarchaeum sp.]|jgi:potassium/hydrogen antiporter|nr:cation:proton antiporter [Candidatus ainarchaeum sp.]MDD4128248.1 cation:proton antiporter [Candidatus ainarchaeum sp.]